MPGKVATLATCSGAWSLLDLLDQLLVGEDEAVDAHVRPVALGDSPLKRPGRLEGPAISTGIAHDWLPS